MAQHDYTIANQTFPNTRADLNNVFAAIVSQNSGATAPSTTYAYMLWYDTTTDILKMRNANDDAWVDLFTIDQVADTATASGAGAAQGSNLIINGAMTIDQRNDGSSLTVPSGGGYSLDRWSYYSAQASKFTIQQSTEAPTGYKNSLLVTSSSAYTVGASEGFSVRQYIEGQNIAHLEFGNSNAKTVTLSFWVRSSLTGSFGGVFWDGAAGTSFYPFSYTISSANTWEQKTVTIAGRQSGTWATDNTAGAAVQFALGTGSSLSGTADAWTSSETLAPTGSTDVVATSGATWYITGVKLEVGSSSTSFIHEGYGTTLEKCQRYFFSFPDAAYNIHAAPYNASLSIAHFEFPVTMRTLATMSITDGAGTSFSTGVSPEGFHHVYSDLYDNFISTFTASAEL